MEMENFRIDSPEAEGERLELLDRGSRSGEGGLQDRQLGSGVEEEFALLDRRSRSRGCGISDPTVP